MRSRLFHSITLLALTGMLAACGFQLRGTGGDGLFYCFAE